MKFDLCHLAVIDDGTPFKGGFVAMCKGVDLNNDILVKRNHKGLTVKDLLSFLNKAVIIVMEDRQSNDVFIPAGIAARYVWNIAPIDGTNILRSTVTIGRELRFAIDINLSALPQLTHNNTQSTIDYLRLNDSNHCCFYSILKLLIEDCGITHAEELIII